MRLILLARRRENYWRNDQIDLAHIKQSEIENVKQAIGRWPFTMPYMLFRGRLRRVAEMSLLFNRFDAIVQHLDGSLVKSMPAGTWVVPMDEDDWLAPHFVDTFRKLSLLPTVSIVTWDTIRHQADGTPKKNGFQESCGYAVKLPCDWQKISNHMTISRSSVHLNEVLAVRNETVASLGYLMNPQHDAKADLKKALESHWNDLPSYFEAQYMAYKDLLNFTR